MYRRNVSDQRKELRNKYRAKHGNDWWKKDSIKDKFDAELKKTPKGSFTRGGKTISEEVDEGIEFAKKRAKKGDKDFTYKEIGKKSRGRGKKRKEKVIKKKFYSDGQKKSSSRKSSAKKSAPKKRAASRGKASKPQFKIGRKKGKFMWELVIGGDIATRSGYKSKATAKKAFLKAVSENADVIEKHGVDSYELFCNVRDL